MDEWRTCFSVTFSPASVTNIVLEIGIVRWQAKANYNGLRQFFFWLQYLVWPLEKDLPAAILHLPYFLDDKPLHFTALFCEFFTHQEALLHKVQERDSPELMCKEERAGTLSLICKGLKLAVLVCLEP